MQPNDAQMADGGGHWQWSALRWGIRCAMLLTLCLVGLAASMYFYSRSLMFSTLDRSVIEQLDLLSARPPEMLPFLIKSRLKRPPPIVTDVGLFTAAHEPVVGDIKVFPPGLRLNGRIQDLAAPEGEGQRWHGAGRVLADGHVLVVARSVDEILGVLSDLEQVVLMFIVPAIGLSLFVGLWMGRKTDRRLRALNDLATPVINGDLSVRLPARAHGDEIDRLCSVVNTILDRLEVGVEALANVGENIAHDIRTPLTSVRMRLDRAQATAAAGSEMAALSDFALKGIDQALGTVTALLRISDIQHRVRASEFETVDLAEIIRDTVEIFQPLADERGLDLRFEGPAGRAIVRADRQLLIEALANLVDNAIKFTPPPGYVTIALGGGAEAPMLTVSDTGVGIPQGEIGSVFRRFVRLDRSRSTRGSGLGLSLVAAIADLHGVTVDVHDNKPGTRIELAFPAQGSVARDTVRVGRIVLPEAAA